MIVGVTLAMFLALECLARVYYFVRKRDHGSSVYAPEGGQFKTDEREFSDIYESTTWGEDYFREKHAANIMDWKSYVYWRKKPFVGEHINVDASGVRKTFNPIPDDPSNTKIFTFGGSTMWGAGARDDGSIASFIARLLHERGYRRFHVTNFGEDGYVFTQELISLLLEIRSGNIPDIAIFYDGVNDSDSVAQTGRAGAPLNEANRIKEFNYTPTTPDYLREKSKFILGSLNLAQRIRPAAPATSQPLILPAPTLPSSPLEEEQALVYWTNLRTVLAMAREFGFEAFFFWQPRLLTKTAVSAEEQRIIDAIGGSDATALQARIYDRMARINPGETNFFDLQKLFSDRTETVYSDLVHIGEEGNKVVAREIVDRIEKRTRKLKRK